MVCLVSLKLALLAPSFLQTEAPALVGAIYFLLLIHLPIAVLVVNVHSRLILCGSQQLLVCLLSLSVLVAWGLWVLIERPTHHVSRNLLLPG